ncbi:MAG: VOC family protein [Alphaproteobacteria bacterium]|jgi:catechol 2,3-dioxygenase-like lactoylglutathione lyase family enzyme
MIVLDRLDHIVLTVRSIERTCAFYVDVLGMDLITFQGNRKALIFGRQKINVHELGKEYEPKAYVPTPGSADLCFLTHTPLLDVIHHLNSLSITIEAGPLERTGAQGPILSVYIRDPDENLIEISQAMS